MDDEYIKVEDTPLVSVEAQETPRMKCLKKARNAHIKCIALAGNDDKKKAACDKELAKAIAKCPGNPIE